MLISHVTDESLGEIFSNAMFLRVLKSDSKIEWRKKNLADALIYREAIKKWRCLHLVLI